MVAHTLNPSIWESEAGGFLNSRPAWSAEFQDSQGYTEKPCLEKQIKKENKKKFWINGAGEMAPQLALTALVLTNASWWLTTIPNEMWCPLVCLKTVYLHVTINL